MIQPAFKEDPRNLFFAFIMALLSYVIFYGVFPLPYIASPDNYIYRIFTNHILCRIIAFLFFWGLWFSIQKLFSIRKQNKLLKILKEGNIPQALEKNLSDIKSYLEHLIIDTVSNKNSNIHKSYFIYALYELIQYQSINIQTHINDFFQNLYERLETSFSIIRIFIWVLPILGFMGTILGITSSIDGFTHSLGFKDMPAVSEAPNSNIEQVFTSLTQVTDGLRTAFDTTFIGLFLVIPLMIVYTVLRNRENELIGDLEDYIKKKIIPVIYPLKDSERHEMELDSLHLAINKLSNTNRDLTENLQILCLKIDEFGSSIIRQKDNTKQDNNEEEE